MRNGYLFAMGSLVALAAGGAAAAEPADAGASGGAELEEIVIRAQKRPEKLQDVPVAAQVVSSQALANSDVADLSDPNKPVSGSTRLSASGVSSILRPTGTINGSPKYSRSRARMPLIAGCVICTLSPARVTFFSVNSAFRAVSRLRSSLW